MLDLMYIVGTILFFALMLLYARGCEALGRRHREAGGDLRADNGATNGRTGHRDAERAV